MDNRLLDWAFSNFETIKLVFREYPWAIVAVAVIGLFAGYAVAWWYYRERIATLKEKLDIAQPNREESHNQTSGVFTEEGVSEEIWMRIGALSVKGDFDARIQLQRNSGDGWGDVLTIAGPIEQTIDNAIPFRFRLKCDQFRRGVAQYILVGAGG